MKLLLAAALLITIPDALHPQVAARAAGALPMLRATDSSLGITQYRTEPVRLEGSTIGSAYVAMELARNEYADSSVEYLFIVTVVDTTGGFYFARGPSLGLDIDGDTVTLAGPGAVISETWDAFRARRPHLPVGAILRNIGHVEIAPFRVAPGLLQTLAEGRRIRVQLTGVPYFERRAVYLRRSLAKQNIDLIRRFVAEWVLPPQPAREGLPLAFFVPAN